MYTISYCHAFVKRIFYFSLRKTCVIFENLLQWYRKGEKNMATELEGNETLQRFIQLLADLNREAVEMIKTGNMQILYAMNDTVEEMYAIQSVGKEDAYTAIEEDMQVICKNFNAMVAMINSNENGKIDQATSVAVNKFLRNIFDANVRIVVAYGLA